MARMLRRRWRDPFVIESDNAAATRFRIRLRRWHPAFWWMAVRMVEPRYLWRPDAWLAVVRAITKAGKA